ncbi:cell division protein ZapA [Blastomonas sp.]|uniref:cell division protein ZapA n=1 Tax=Blastomonas sp. TaxID=1909299 RepID=UPI002623126A|nr:cell division protein ZapA [Blastomonas sp.]MDM7954872.1 cell division protein ZapA [Blastomonas sp.]
MPDIRLSIAGRIYTVTCQPGEEEHLARLGSMMDAAARKAGASGGLNETRALLFAGLLMADDLAEAQDREADQNPSAPVDAETENAPADPLEHDNDAELAAHAIERLAARIENMAEALEKQTDQS